MQLIEVLTTNQKVPGSISGPVFCHAVRGQGRFESIGLVYEMLAQGTQFSKRVG